MDNDNSKYHFTDRKLSYPTTFLHKRHQHFKNQQGSDNELSLNDDSLRNITRRFSNVSDTFSKKLNSWRMITSELSSQEVVSDGKSLCGQFIRGRLKRSGVFHKKFGLQRIRSIIFKLNDNHGTTYNILHQVGLELEKMYPHIYSDIIKQTLQSLNPTVVLTDKLVKELFKTLAQDILKNDITWSKVVAVYCVAGGLSVDCVKCQRPEFIHDILEAMSEVLEHDLAEWIVLNGGWVTIWTFISLVMHFSRKNPLTIPKITIYATSAIFIFCLLVSFVYYGL